MRHVQRVRSHVQLSEPTEDGLRAAHGTGSHVAPLFDPDDDRAQPLRKRALTRVIRSITILGWIRQYSRVDLFGDLRSGLTVSVILVPQAIAYALLVEVQPVYGLYSAFVPLFAYAIFTTARHVSIGPFALLSLVVASVAKGLVPTDHTDAEYLSCVLTLSVLSGIVQIVMGCVGLGVIASLLADPCIAGFTTAVALIIMASQLKYLLGVKLASASMPETVISALGALFSGNVNWWAVLVTVAAFVLMHAIKAAGQRWCKQVPLFEQLVAVVLFTGINHAARLPVDSIGVIQGGMPPLALPRLPASLELWGAYLQGAVLIAFTGFLVTMSMARVFAARHSYDLDSNQELIALGASNLVGGMFSAFPVCGSFSRSAVASALGGRSPLHGVVQALVIALVLLVLTPLFRSLPFGVLAAIIFAALQSLVDFSAARTLWRSSRADFALWMIAFVVTAILDVQVGLIVSLAASLGLLVLRTSRPRWVVLGRLPGTDIWRDVTRYPTATSPPHALICRFDAPLHFANASYFASAMRKRLRVLAATEGAPRTTHVLLDCSSIHTLDASANTVLRQLVAELHAKDVAFMLALTRAPFREALLKFGTMADLIGDNNCFVTLTDGVERGCARPRQPPTCHGPDVDERLRPALEGGELRVEDDSDEEGQSAFELGRRGSELSLPTVGAPSPIGGRDELGSARAGILPAAPPPPHVDVHVSVV